MLANTSCTAKCLLRIENIRYLLLCNDLHLTLDFTPLLLGVSTPSYVLIPAKPLRLHRYGYRRTSRARYM